MHNFILFLTIVLFSISSFSFFKSPISSPDQALIQSSDQNPIGTLFYCEQQDHGDTWYKAGVAFTGNQQNPQYYLYVVQHNHDTEKDYLTNRVQVFPGLEGYADYFDTAKIKTYQVPGAFTAYLSTIIDGAAKHNGVNAWMNCWPGGWISYDEVMLPQGPQSM